MVILFRFWTRSRQKYCERRRNISSLGTLSLQLENHGSTWTRSTTSLFWWWNGNRKFFLNNFFCSYLLNPITICTCAALSISVVHNALIALVAWSLFAGKFFLQLETFFSQLETFFIFTVGNMSIRHNRLIYFRLWDMRGQCSGHRYSNDFLSGLDLACFGSTRTTRSGAIVSGHVCWVFCP